MELFPRDPEPGQDSTQAADLDDDQGIQEVEKWFRQRSGLEERFAEVFRQSIDEVLDGQRTGRYDVNHLAKTEKTYLGTKVEIVCQDAFGIERGRHMDYSISGHEVDAKFSIEKAYTQSIPREAVGQICLLLHADDHRQKFTVGLLRITPDVLSPGKGNQDGKRTILASARKRIRWLIADGTLPENLLLNLSSEVRDSIFRGAASRQQRVNQLFRLVQGRIIRRETVLAVAQQDDGPKRARDARIQLRGDGILVLGHQEAHPRIAQDLELPVPRKGEWVSIRIIPRPAGGHGGPETVINGDSYVRAQPSDPIWPAPARY